MHRVILWFGTRAFALYFHENDLLLIAIVNHAVSTVCAMFVEYFFNCFVESELSIQHGTKS